MLPKIGQKRNERTRRGKPSGVTRLEPRAAGYGPTAFYPLQGAVLPFAPTEAAGKDAAVDRSAICQ
jgi:hypothetical protein